MVLSAAAQTTPEGGTVIGAITGASSAISSARAGGKVDTTLGSGASAGIVGN